MRIRENKSLIKQIEILENPFKIWFTCICECVYPCWCVRKIEQRQQQQSHNEMHVGISREYYWRK